MRIAILGQQKFGQAVLEAFLERGHEVAGVFCAPDKPGAALDPIKSAATDRRLPVHQLASLRTEEARAVLRALDVDLAIMAYVLQFAPGDFTSIPRHGTIQFHPSLLPRYRGPSAINWPIIRGDTRTGLTIFRPTAGLDEGPVLLQKETHIGPDDTLGVVYFERLFPMGVAALLEAADQVVAGTAEEVLQDEAQAGYEGWCRAPEALINWRNHVDLVYNLIRGCDPAPGAWTLFRGRKLQLFDARKHLVRRFSEVTGDPGTVAAIGERAFRISAHGGQLEVAKVRYDDGPKMSGAEFCRALQVTVGAALGA
jgi:methionyl-tRNA formyltransferase